MRPLLLSLVLLGCGAKGASASEISALQQQNTALEARVAKLEETLERVMQVVTVPASPEREEAAYQVAMQIRGAMDDLDLGKARELLTQITTDYGDTTFAAQAAELLKQLAIIGNDGSMDGVDKWLLGEHGPLDAEKTTMLVSFEAWCPHCRNEIPVVQKVHETMSAEGIDVIGITGLSRGTSEEDMATFLADNKVSFPVAYDSGVLGQRFGAAGVPHAAIIRGGKITWVGHPANLTGDDAAGLRKLLAR
jgi:thiol-disulfide isomerase/thioredoxin